MQIFNTHLSAIWSSAFPTQQQNENKEQIEYRQKYNETTKLGPRIVDTKSNYAVMISSPHTSTAPTTVGTQHKPDFKKGSVSI